MQTSTFIDGTLNYMNLTENIVSQTEAEGTLVIVSLELTLGIRRLMWKNDIVWRPSTSSRSGSVISMNSTQ